MECFRICERQISSERARGEAGRRTYQLQPASSLADRRRLEVCLLCLTFFETGRTLKPIDSSVEHGRRVRLHRAEQRRVVGVYRKREVSWCNWEGERGGSAYRLCSAPILPASHSAPSDASARHHQSRKRRRMRTKTTKEGGRRWMRTPGRGGWRGNRRACSGQPSHGTAGCRGSCRGSGW